MNAKLSTGKIVGLIILGVLVVVLLWGFSTYNSLVTLNENAKTSQSDVEVAYQRRFDLIPNLVASVEGIMQQEKTVFQNLADARSKYAGSVPGSSDRVAAVNQVDSSLSRLLVVMENYPVLKSAENVIALQNQLEGTENRISVARSNFNAVVNELNKKVQFFPSNIVANMFGFAQRDRFAATEQAANTVPEVKFEIK